MHYSQEAEPTTLLYYLHVHVGEFRVLILVYRSHLTEYCCTNFNFVCFVYRSCNTFLFYTLFCMDRCCEGIYLRYFGNGIVTDYTHTKHQK